jgi:2-methylcitrate dehydratase PrpD
MAHSPAYFLAAGAADRDFSWIHATPENISDPVIHQLIDKVRVGVPPTENVSRYRQGATVTIRAKDGCTSTSTVFEPKGSAARGIAWDDVDSKYRTLVPRAGVPERQIEASLAVIHGIRDVNDVSKLIDLLQVSRHASVPLGTSNIRYLSN